MIYKIVCRGATKQTGSLCRNKTKISHKEDHYFVFKNVIRS